MVKDFDNFILDKTYYLSRDGAMCPISIITWDSDNWYADYCDRDANYHTKDQIKYCIYSLEPVGEDIVLKKHFFNNFKEDIIELLITNDTIVRLSNNKLKLFMKRLGFTYTGESRETAFSLVVNSNNFYCSWDVAKAMYKASNSSVREVSK